MKNTLKITSTILCFVIAFYACNSTPNLTSKNEVKVEEINSIDDLIKYGNALTKPEDRYNYYKQLCKLQKAQEWQADKRLKFVPVLEIIKAIDTLYYEFEGRPAEDEEDKQKTFSSDSITNTSLVKTLDSLYPINKLEFTSRLESSFYGDFFGSIIIEDFSKDEYKDKNDERLVNPNFLTFSYFKCEACGGYQESYFLLNSGKLKKLDLAPSDKSLDLFYKKIGELMSKENPENFDIEGTHIETRAVSKIIKVKEGVHEIHLHLYSEGGKNAEGEYEKYPTEGELKYQIKDYKTIISNTVEFHSERTGKWYKL